MGVSGCAKIKCEFSLNNKLNNKKCTLNTIYNFAHPRQRQYTVSARYILYDYSRPRVPPPPPPPIPPRRQSETRKMLSFYAMKYNEKDKPRDDIWRYMIEYSSDKDAKDPGLYTLAMMDGGIRKIRPENYSGLLQNIFKQGKENGNVPW